METIDIIKNENDELKKRIQTLNYPLCFIHFLSIWIL